MGIEYIGMGSKKKNHRGICLLLFINSRPAIHNDEKVMPADFWVYIGVHADSNCM